MVHEHCKDALMEQLEADVSPLADAIRAYIVTDGDDDAVVAQFARLLTCPDDEFSGADLNYAARKLVYFFRQFMAEVPIANRTVRDLTHTIRFQMGFEGYTRPTPTPVAPVEEPSTGP